MSEQLDEETRRIIKLFRPAKDAETSWRIDVSAELAWYLDMLQRGSFEEPAPAPETGDAGPLATVMANQGINFTHASAVVMEATRVFSRKVDFLRRQMDSTLTNLAVGHVSQKPKAKGRGAQKDVKASQLMPEWDLPELPDHGVDLLHLPWDKIASKGPAQRNCLEDEYAVMWGTEPVSAPAWAADPMTVSISRKLLISRPSAYLLPKIQVHQNLAKDTASFNLLRYMQSFNCMYGSLDSQGILRFPFWPTRLDAGVGNHMMASPPVSPFAEISPNVVGSRRSSVQPPCPSAMAATAVGCLTAAGGGATAAGAPSIFSPRPDGRKIAVATLKVPVKRKPKSDLLDEHEVIGKDAPYQKGKTWTGLDTSKYCVSLEELVAKNLAFDELMVAACGSLGVERFLYDARKGLVRPQHLRLPFFDEVKVPTGSGNWYYNWSVPMAPRTREMETEYVTEEAGGEGAGQEDMGTGADFGDAWDDPTADLLTTIERAATTSVMSAPGGAHTRDLLYQMHERVGAWREKVEDWIRAAEQEEPFAVPVYVDKIKHAMEVEHANEPLLSFSDICQRNHVTERYEVCRLFLTTLLLVNKHSLPIQPTPDNGSTSFILDVSQVNPSDIQIEAED